MAFFRASLSISTSIDCSLFCDRLILKVYSEGFVVMSFWFQLRAMLLFLGCCLRVIARRMALPRRAVKRRFDLEVLQLFLRQGIEDALNLPLEVARRRIPSALLPWALRQKLKAPEVQMLGQCRAELLLPRTLKSESATILYFHGGGYVACSPSTHRPLCAALAVEANARVFSLDYRLAPEHPFPAAIDDGVAAYRALLAEKGARPLFLAGDSAGGGLVMATLLTLKRLGLAMPAGAVLFSPWVDLTLSSQSLRNNASTCYLVPASLEIYRRAYLGEGDPSQPEASPLWADLQGMPPLFIQAGGGELLRDESEMLARFAKAAGVTVQLEIEPTLFHAYPVAVAILPEAQKAVTQAAKFMHTCNQA